MASTVDKQAASEATRDALAVVLDERAYEKALTDPKVRELHEDADALVRELDADGRNL